jgi:uncharacterized membrane protein
MFVALIFILILALILRLPLLNGSFWLDEAAQALESARPLYQQLDIIPDFQPPLLHLLTHLAFYLGQGFNFGHQEWWLRFWGALLPGLITIAATFYLGRKLFNHTTGFIAALFLTTSSFHIFYSQELRPYSLPAMFATLSWLSLIHFLRQSQQQAKSEQSGQIRPSHTGQSRVIKRCEQANAFRFTLTTIKTALPYTLLTIAGLYSSYLYPFLILSQVAYVVCLHWPQLKSYLLSLLVATLAFMPWLPTFWQQLQAGQQLRQTLPGWEKVVSLTQIKSLPLTLGKFLFGVIDLDLKLTFVIPALLVGFLTIFTLWHSIRARLKSRLKSGFKSREKLKPKTTAQLSNLCLILIWLFLPLLSAWLISFLIPVVRPKRVLFLMPAFYLFLAHLIHKGLAPNKLQNGGQAILTKLKEGRGLLKFLFWPNQLIQSAQLTQITITQLSAGLLFILILGINLSGSYRYYTQPQLQREDWRGLQQELNQRLPVQDTIAVFSFKQPFAPWRWYQQQLPARRQFTSLATGYNYIQQVPDLHQQLKPIFDHQFVLVFDYLRDLTDPHNRLPQAVQAMGFQSIGVISRPNLGQVHIYARPQLAEQTTGQEKQAE